ncbi:hypothetical protein Q31a_47790 [Aureliella helgolandensis]|uniref:Uncharacterized protein n=1 Tax=Aureliella helgolandensis TaxID=2527968 RepID=A0A518GCT1_9BACT|nr:hypothetical protein Q31a_47790 [Aureliella helgolandensis]
MGEEGRERADKMLRSGELAWYYSSPLSLAGASLVQQRVLLAGR